MGELGTPAEVPVTSAVAVARAKERSKPREQQNRDPGYLWLNPPPKRKGPSGYLWRLAK